MMMRVKLIAAAAVTVMILAIGLFWMLLPRESELTGEVFIVTEGRANVKIGLVEVGAVSESEMKKYLAVALPRANAELESAKAEYARVNADAKDASHRWVDLTVARSKRCISDALYQP